MEESYPTAEWQNDALKVFNQVADPEIRFQVFERTVSTATRDLELLRVRNADEIKLLMASMTSDTGEAATNEGPFKVVMDDRGANTLSAGQVAVHLDGQLFPEDATFLRGTKRSHRDRGIHVPDFIVRREYGTIEQFHGRISKLAQLLYRHFGEECVDLVLGLIGFFVKDAMGESMLSAETISAATMEKKKAIIEGMFARMEPLQPGEEDAILRWALGGRFHFRLSKNCETLEEKLDLLKKLVQTKSSFRRKLLRSVRHLTLTADHLVSSALVRWGWKTISEVDEVTDFEWWTYIRDMHEHIKEKAAAGDEYMQKLLATKSQRERFELSDRRMERFFELHPNPPPEETVRKLRDVIGCDRLRAELEKLEEEHNPRGYDEKQREILARVSSAVSRYIIEQTRGHKDEEEAPSWSRGFPINFEESKSGTCFTGPWLIAVMLMECGIDYNDLLYVHVNQAHDGQLGGHGGLILRTRLQHNVFIDHGYNFASRDLPTAGASSKEEAELVNALLTGQIREAVTVLFKHHEVDRIHRHMQLMPLIDGFASGHLYHVGLSFLTGEKFSHAKYALELALMFNRQDPDILYYLGHIGLKENNLVEAEAYFQEALKVFPNHLFSEFGLGECAARRGDMDKAKSHFIIVAESPFSIWKANELKDQAKRFANSPESAVQSGLASARLLH